MYAIEYRIKNYIQSFLIHIRAVTTLSPPFGSVYDRVLDLILTEREEGGGVKCDTPVLGIKYLFIERCFALRTLFKALLHLFEWRLQMR